MSGAKKRRIMRSHRPRPSLTAMPASSDGSLLSMKMVRRVYTSIMQRLHSLKASLGGSCIHSPCSILRAAAREYAELFAPMVRMVTCPLALAPSAWSLGSEELLWAVK